MIVTAAVAALHDGRNFAAPSGALFAQPQPNNPTTQLKTNMATNSHINHTRLIYMAKALVAAQIPFVASVVYKLGPAFESMGATHCAPIATTNDSVCECFLLRRRWAGLDEFELVPEFKHPIPVRLKSLREPTETCFQP
jgi:hypothetical protein